MATISNISGWQNTDWHTPKYEITDELIDIIGKILIEKINTNDGSWQGTFGELINIAKLSPDYYSTVFRAMPIIKDKFDIHSEKLGRHGNKYSLNKKDNVQDTSPDVSNDTIQQIKYILNGLGSEPTNEQLRIAFNIIKQIRL